MARDAPERHRTLRAAIGWSEELLPDDERIVFRKLAVWVGGVVFPDSSDAATPINPLNVLLNLIGVLGAILMGIPMITRQVYPRWCGYVLLLEAVLAAISFFGGGPGPSSRISQILNVVSAVPLFLVLGWAGYELWSGKSAASGATNSVVAAQPAGA